MAVDSGPVLREGPCECHLSPSRKESLEPQSPLCPDVSPWGVGPLGSSSGLILRIRCPDASDIFPRLANFLSFLWPALFY